MLLERSVSSFLCLGDLVDDIDVFGALSFLVLEFKGSWWTILMLLERLASSFLCLGELVDDIDVFGALSFLVPVFRGAGG
jgi:hypothetical protein